MTHKQALLELCLRNAMKCALGEIKMSHDIQTQIQFAYYNCNEQTRKVLKSVFGIIDFNDMEERTE